MHTNEVAHTLQVLGLLHGHDARIALQIGLEALLDFRLPNLRRQLDLRKLRGVDALNLAWLIDRLKGCRSTGGRPFEVFLSTDSAGDRLGRQIYTYLMVLEINFGTELSPATNSLMLSFS